MEKEIIAYQTKEGKEPFIEWVHSFKDKVIKYRIEARVKRIKYGNFGDHKRFYGIIEMRLDFGKGYRIYCGEDGNDLVILLAGGDKGFQEQDIKLAQEYWRDYNEQKKI